MPPKTAIVYVRVSDREQADANVSIPAQVEAAESWCLEREASILRIFQDAGRSAFKAGNRPLFDAAVDMAITAAADYFVVWSSSRFARTRIEAVTYKMRLDRAGVQLVYLSSPVDRSTDSGWMVDSFMEVVNELHSRLNGADTKRSMVRNAKLGHFCGGRVVFGYQAVASITDEKRRRLEPVPEEAAIVRQIFADRARGIGATLIARQLNDRGQLHRGKRWHKRLVLDLLHNRALIGQSVFNRSDRRTGRDRDPSEWIIVDSHVAIIDRDVWDSVQEDIAEAQPGGGVGSPLSTHAFTGLLRCGRCGASMQIETARGRSATYAYYSCRTAQQHDGCERIRYRADEMDEWLSSVILSSVLTAANLRSTAEAIALECDRWKSERAGKRADVLTSITACRRRQGNLYEVLELHGKDAPNLGDLTVRLRQINAEIRELEGQLSQLDAEPPAPPPVNDVDIGELAEFLQGEFRRADNAPAAREFYRGFISEIIVQRSSVDVVYDKGRLVDQPTPVHSTLRWLPETDSNRRPSD